MAERRMFAKTIVTSDAFLDMPATARCLYFTLAMFADDDGFVNNPKSIMRQAGSTTDDMRILIEKKFVLAFESGVIVIKHWRIHNYIQSDRYHPTKYQDEKSLLMLDDNKAYTQSDTPCIQDVSIADTEVRLGKDRIGKVNNTTTKDIYKGLPENLVTALKDFEEMRKKLKAPMTDKAKELLLSKLTKLAGDDDDLKVRILEQSVEHSWKGVYGLKEDTDGNNFGSGFGKRSKLSGNAGRGYGDAEEVDTRNFPMAADVFGKSRSKDNA